MIEILSLLLAAVVAVLVFNRLKLGSILGYLAAGMVIGPYGLALVTDAVQMRHIGEFGVIFLLFIIGIEMKPQRLWVMRRLVFGLGGIQVALTALLVAGIVHFALGVSPASAVVIGGGLALSSTAFGTQILSERRQLASHWGRASISVLLLQDVMVVPFMLAVPVLAVGSMDIDVRVMAVAAAKAAAAIAAVVVVGRFVTGPLLHAIARSKSGEAFVAVALLLVLGFAWVMEMAGLSMAMGAFIAGVMLADSEYRHQVEADVLPFRGLLLGLFFMSVGMTLAPAAVAANLSLVVGGTLALVALKCAVLIALCRPWGVPLPVAVRTGFLLSQAGEFGFVLFALADSYQILPDGMAETLVSVVVLSMMATPVMMRIADIVAQRLDGGIAQAEPEHDIAERPVLIAGFGRVGHTVAKMFRAADVPIIAVDADTDNVASGRRKGYRVYYGDAGRADVLRAVGAGSACLMVVTVDDPHASEAIVRTVRRLYPHLPLHVRARDWESADRMVSLGVEHALPETLEASLRLGAAALREAGVDDEKRARLFDELRADNFAKMRD